MYPRNAASPERIAIGAVVQISDGAVQGSGCTITVRGQGGAEGAGGGTTAYGATGVVVYYTPLQAETDFTSFVVIASKSGCIPVAVTIVTTASSVPGRTMPADGSVTAAVVATGAIDADAIADGAIDAGALATDAITAAKIAADAGTEIGTAVWATTTRVLTASTNLSDLDDATLAAIAALNNLSQANVRTAVGLGSANLDTQLGDLPTNAELATALGTADDAVLAAIAALNNLSAAQVNAEVLDVLNVDTFAQPGQGTPAATTSMRLMLNYLYKAFRNKSTQTATEYNLFNDDASTVDQKSAVSDDSTTFTRDELASGP